jgi:hypothetical protein
MNTNENNTTAATAQELAAQQQEREQRAISTATTILRQIKADPDHLSDSWAMQRPTATHYQGAPALCFEVNALQHTGRVIVSLDEGRDLYDIRTLSDKGETMQERTGVFCDDLAAQIDEMVERPATMTDAEYIAALRKLGNPTLNWLLDKREAGQKGKIIIV